MPSRLYRRVGARKGCGPALLFVLWVPVCVFHLYESGDIVWTIRGGVELLLSLLLERWRVLASTVLTPPQKNTTSTTRPPQYTYCESLILKLGSPYKTANTGGRYGHDTAVVVP